MSVEPQGRKVSPRYASQALLLFLTAGTFPSSVHPISLCTVDRTGCDKCYEYTQVLSTFDLSYPTIQQLEYRIHSHQHSLVWSLPSDHLGMSEIDEFHQKRRTRLGILLLLFVFVLIFIFPHVPLHKESDSFSRAFEVAFVDDQKAASNHPNLKLCKRIPDGGDVASDGLDDR